MFAAGVVALVAGAAGMPAPQTRAMTAAGVAISVATSPAADDRLS